MVRSAMRQQKFSLQHVITYLRRYKKINKLEARPDVKVLTLINLDCLFFKQGQGALSLYSSCRTKYQSKRGKQDLMMRSSQ